MTDDQRAAKWLVNTAQPEHVLKLFQAVGSALLQCQNAENRLAEFIVLMYESQPPLTRQQAWDRVDELSGETLGALMRELRRKTTIEQGTDDLLREFLRERNWLAHGIQRGNGLDVYDPARFKLLMQRIEEVAQRAVHLQAELVKIAVAFAEKMGVTPAELDAAMVQNVQSWVSTGKRHD